MSNVLAPVDPLADLPDEIHADMLGVLRRITDAGLRLEKNPAIPSMLGTRVEGIMFQVTVLFDTGGNPTRVAIFAPGAPSTFGDPNTLPLVEWPREDFLALLPDPVSVPEPDPPVPMAPLTFLPDERATLLEIRDLLVEIRNRLP